MYHQKTVHINNELDYLAFKQTHSGIFPVQLSNSIFISPFKGLRLTQSKKNTINQNQCGLLNIVNQFKNTNINKTMTHISRMIDKNILRQEERPCYYLHRITTDTHVSTGILATLNLAALNSRIQIHEHTLPDKKAIYLNSLNECPVQINPILVLHRYNQSIEKYLNSLIIRIQPDISITYNDVNYQVWIIEDSLRISEITDLFYQIPNYYIADGHHRLAALNSFYNQKNIKNKFFLAMLVSENNVKIASYNRLIHQFGDLDEVFFSRLRKKFALTKLDTLPDKASSEKFMLYYNKNWISMTCKNSLNTEHPYQIIDKTFFNETLNLDGKNKSAFFTHIPGVYGLNILKQKVDQLQAKAALVLPILSKNDFFNLVDQRYILPQHSTWFEPKLMDGFISYHLNDAKQF